VVVLRDRPGPRATGGGAAVPNYGLRGESWRFGTGGFSGRRPSEAPAWPSGEPPAVALQPRGAIQAEEDDGLIGQHRDLDLAAQPAERERNHGLSQFGGAADVASAFVVRHRDGQAVFRSHDRTTLRPAPEQDSGDAFDVAGDDRAPTLTHRRNGRACGRSAKA